MTGTVTHTTVGAGSSGGVHPTEKETYPWQMWVVDHEKRNESGEFRAAKATLKKILATLDLADLPYGPGPWEAHHGGSLWVLTASGWRMFRARAGIEWCVQFCADPVKIDRLRLDARELMAAFPRTVPALAEFGYTHAQEVLDTPIVTADDIGRWTDSIFNACVPMSRLCHQGVLPAAPGEHHYPWPAKSADLIRRDDFQLWVTLSDGTHVAVSPTHPRGSDNGELQLLHARHGTPAGDALIEGQTRHTRVLIPADTEVALDAFRLQIPSGSQTASVPLQPRTTRRTQQTRSRSR